MSAIPSSTPGLSPRSNAVDAGDRVSRIFSGSESHRCDDRHVQRLAALGTLSAALAHEFNNILTLLLSYTSTAIEAVDEPALQRRALERSRDAAQRAARASAAVMGLAHSEGTESLTAQVAVAEAINAVANLMGWFDSGTDTQLSVRVIPPDLTAAVDRAGLEQALLNLLQNARRAMGAGGRVEIVARRDPTTKGIRLTVHDSGPGVSPGRVSSLFEPFVSHASRPHQGADGSGTGLGLWISRVLLESAGGSLDLLPADPARGGACFELRLPDARGDSRVGLRAA